MPFVLCEYKFLVFSKGRRTILFGNRMDQVVYSWSHTPELGVLICVYYLQITKLARNLLDSFRSPWLVFTDSVRVIIKENTSGRLPEASM